jgi:hypothetical protein
MALTDTQVSYVTFGILAVFVICLIIYTIVDPIIRNSKISPDPNAQAFSYDARLRLSDNKWQVVGRRYAALYLLGQSTTPYNVGFMIMSKPPADGVPLTKDNATVFDSKSAAYEFYNLKFSDSPPNKVYLEDRENKYADVYAG